MKKIFIFSLLLLAGLSAKAQDFKVIDYTKGYEVEHKPDKSQKVNIMKPAIALTFFDFDSLYHLLLLSLIKFTKEFIRTPFYSAQPYFHFPFFGWLADQLQHVQQLELDQKFLT